MKLNKLFLSLALFFSVISGVSPVHAEEETGMEVPEITETEETIEETAEVTEETVVEEEDEALPKDGEPVAVETVYDFNPMYEGTLTEEDLDKLHEEALEAGEKSELLNASRTCSNVNEASVWARGQMKSRASSMSITVNVNKSSAYSSGSDAWHTVFKQILEGAFAHTGTGTEGDYIYWHYGGSSASGSYTTYDSYYKLVLDYTLKWHSTASQESSTTTAINNVISSLPVTKTSSEYDRAYYIFKWITENVYYTDASDYSTNMYYHTCYSAVVNKDTVCQGYSLLFYRLALTLGLQCRMVAGDAPGGNHGWNIVKVDGKWYNIDSTWDAQRSPSNWNYFLKAKSPFIDTHSPWGDRLGFDSLNYQSSAWTKKYGVAGKDYVEQDSYAKLNKIKEFVKRLYTKCLGRSTPDEKGLLNWTGLLSLKKRDAASVVKSFFISTEYKNRNRSDTNFIKDCYQVMMGRSYDSSGLNHWRSFLQDDFVSRVYVLKGFVASKEFTQICEEYGVTKGTVAVTEGRDRNINVTRFVVRLYQMAMNRNPDTGGLNTWCDKIVDKKTTPKAAAIAFLDSTEFKNFGYSDEEFVEILYWTFFDRAADTGGMNGWLNKLAKGATRRSVIEGFADSAEFANLVKKFGL